MLTDQCISVTDLRTNTKACLEGLKEGEKYVFINNRPTAVLIDIDEFEKHFGVCELKPLPKNQISSKLILQAKKARDADSSEFVDL